MKIIARVDNSKGQNHVTLTTNDNSHSIIIPTKPSGFGSSANSGELFFLALATCYCNDIYREAATRNIRVEKVEVEGNGDFSEEGEPAKNVTYRARVSAKGTKEEVEALLQHTDKITEVKNSPRVGMSVVLSGIEVTST